MSNINITFEGLERTDAIVDHISKSFSKVTKFFDDNYLADFKVKDLTPNKKTGNDEYEIIISLRMHKHGKDNHHDCKHRDADLYFAIDKAIDILEEQLRRSHDKSSKKFNQFKSVVRQKYENLFKRQASKK